MDAVIAHILICEIIVIIPIDWDINSIQNNYFVFFHEQFNHVIDAGDDNNWA